MVNQYSKTFSSTAMLVALLATTAAADTFVPRGPNDTLENRAEYKARQKISRSTGGIPGCMDENAANYNQAANVQQIDQYGNVLCTYATCAEAPDGCMYGDSTAALNPPYFVADNCISYEGIVCGSSSEEDTLVNPGIDPEKRYGCRDDDAVNYNAEATTDELNQDGDVKCIYNLDCSTVPQDGCVFPDSFALYKPGFDPTDCTTSDGTHCIAPDSPPAPSGDSGDPDDDDYDDSSSGQLIISGNTFNGTVGIVIGTYSNIDNDLGQE